MDLDRVKTFLGNDWLRVQQCIREELQSGIDLLNSTNDSILSSSGKQLRPVLALLAARAAMVAKGERPVLPDDVIRYAAAAELLHNATLLHDDVADGSDRRRGRPTVNSIMGPSVSVLVGDFWLVRAMDCILKADNHTDQVQRVFSRTLGNLAEGEMLQLQKAETGDTSFEDYFDIIFNKTASLFQATVESAMIGVGADERIRTSLVNYAVALGLAFQIRDDIFDYTPGIDVGKPVGADILERKMTLPLLGALSLAPASESERIRGMVTAIGDNADSRDDVVAFVREYDGIGYAQKILSEKLCFAISQLSVLPPSPESSLLEELAEFVGNRNI